MIAIVVVRTLSILRNQMVSRSKKAQVLRLVPLLWILAACAGAGSTATPTATGTATASAAGSSSGGGIGGMTWLWALVLIVAVGAAYWGSEHLAQPLKRMRRQWGLSELAGAAFIGLATASPEMGINITSAIRGVSDIGLGAMMGANLIAIPLVVTVAYWAYGKTRTGNRQEKSAQSGSEPSPDGVLPVQQEAITVQIVPYLVILGVFALLTLPQAWRGLQPLDGWIMLGVYLVYLVQAVLRGRQDKEEVEWTNKEVALAVGGLVALAVGAYFTVFSTENLVSAFGISKIVGGLFLTAPVAALPETFAVWKVVRSGQVTTGTTGVLGDLAVTMTLAVLPLALITVPVQNLQLYAVSLFFLALIPAVYAILIRWGRSSGLTLWQVVVLALVYLVYLAIMLFGVLNVI